MKIWRPPTSCSLLAALVILPNRAVVVARLSFVIRNYDDSVFCKTMDCDSLHNPNVDEKCQGDYHPLECCAAWSMYAQCQHEKCKRCVHTISRTTTDCMLYETLQEKTDDICSTAKPTTWIPIGQDLVGENLGDWFGGAVALSSDGTILAVGSPYNSDNGVESGLVRVYALDTSSEQWKKLGQDLNGQNAGDSFGNAVALSADGTILAASAVHNDNDNGIRSGQVQVFEYNSGTDSWNQIGQNLIGEADYDWFGWSLALSATGNIVVAGGPGNDGHGTDSGRVRVFSFNRDLNQWEQLGDNLDGKQAGEQYGISVDVSAAGTGLAAGAWFNNDNGVRAGRVEVLEYRNDEKSWGRVGKNLEGDDEEDRFGRSVAMSANGTTVAAGAYQGNGTSGDDDLGYVQVNRLNAYKNRWQQVGENIEGKESVDHFGSAVAISADGNVVAAGSDWNDENGLWSGHVRVFGLNRKDKSWNQLGMDLEGDALDGLGYSVAMSADGTIVAAGGPWNNAGHVRVYKGVA